MKFVIPESGPIEIDCVVFDLNGTLADGGRIPEDVRDGIRRLADHYHLILLSADTFGTAAAEIEGLPITFQPLDPGPTGAQKRRFVRERGAHRIAAFGNGVNDALMLREAALGFAVIGPEGVAFDAIVAADIVVTDILDGFAMLLDPKRLAAGLRP